MNILVLIAALAAFQLTATAQKDDKSKVVSDIEEEDKWMVTKTAFLDISVDLEEPKRVVIALFGEAAQNTVTNFATLVKGNYRGDPKFGYKGTKIHRIVPDFVIQGGDVENDDGSGGKSIYGRYFSDEDFHHSHSGPGYISMANKGTPDTNSSQFFILIQRARWLDNKHVVFGKVIEGMDIIKAISDLDKTENGVPKKLVSIEDCGLIRHDPYVLPEDQR